MIYWSFRKGELSYRKQFKHVVGCKWMQILGPFLRRIRAERAATLKLFASRSGKYYPISSFLGTYLYLYYCIRNMTLKKSMWIMPQTSGQILSLCYQVGIGGSM